MMMMMMMMTMTMTMTNDDDAAAAADDDDDDDDNNGHRPHTRSTLIFPFYQSYSIRVVIQEIPQIKS